MLLFYFMFFNLNSICWGFLLWFVAYFFIKNKIIESICVY